MKCPECGSFVEIERMNFIYEQGRNIRVERTHECENGHTFKAKEKKALARVDPRRKKEALERAIRKNRRLV